MVPGQDSILRKAYSPLSKEVAAVTLSLVCTAFPVYCSADMLAWLNGDYMSACPSPQPSASSTLPEDWNHIVSILVSPDALLSRRWTMLDTLLLDMGGSQRRQGSDFIFPHPPSNQGMFGHL